MVPAAQPVNLECWQQSRVIILSPLLITVLTEVTFYAKRLCPISFPCSDGYVPQSTDQKSRLSYLWHLGGKSLPRDPSFGEGASWRDWSTNTIPMYMENMGGLHRLIVHPEWLSEWVSIFFNRYTEEHLRKLHLHSSFPKQSLFSYLYGDL